MEKLLKRGRRRRPAHATLKRQYRSFHGVLRDPLPLCQLRQDRAIMAIAAAHRRFNYIHPFADGSGRVSRLMSHAMAHKAGIGAHGVWSVSIGLARGLESRTDYKRMMDYADTPRQGDRDGRGSLSQKALADFTEWFLKVCLDRVTFMSELFDISNLSRRLQTCVHRSDRLNPQAANPSKRRLYVVSSNGARRRELKACRSARRGES